MCAVRERPVGRQWAPTPTRGTTRRQLQDSEELSRLLVEGVLDYAIFALDPAGHVTSWNAGARRAKGYQADEIVGEHFSVFYPPGDQAAGKPAAELIAAVADGRFEDEGWRVRKDGTQFWADVIITPVYDDASQLRGYSKVTRDVTKTRADAHELAAERNRLKEAQRLGQLGSFTYDVSSEEFTFSEQIYRIWGLAQNADLALLRRQLIHPDDLFRVMQGWGAALAAGSEHAIAYRIVRPDGTTGYLSVAIEVALNAAGDAVSLHGTHHDITDLTLAQQAAVKAGTLFNAILTATPDYTFVTDLHSGAAIYGSPGKTILGITTEELSNRAMSMDRLEAALARAAQTQRDVAILFCDLDGFKRVNDTRWPRRGRRRAHRDRCPTQSGAARERHHRTSGRRRVCHRGRAVETNRHYPPTGPGPGRSCPGAP